MPGKTLCLALCLAALGLGCASIQGPPVASTAAGAVTIEQTQVFTHHSPLTNQTYRIKLALPDSHGQEGETRRYPLILKIDGQWDYLLALNAFHGLSYDGQMPDVVIAGVDWGEVDDIQYFRARDLLPSTPPGFPDGGHADKFLQVLNTEIIPLLEERARLSGERILLGSSWGAVFATYALFETPEQFTGAIAVAGGYDVAKEVFAAKLQKLKGSDALADKRLYLSVGDLDVLAPQVAAFGAALKKAAPAGFALRVDEFTGYGHSGANTPSYAAGYQFLFERPRIELPASRWNALAGTYRGLQEGPELVLIRTPAGLDVQYPDGYRAPLWAQSATEFYSPGEHFELRFDEQEIVANGHFGEMKFARPPRR